jgi:hypothetical protein
MLRLLLDGNEMDLYENESVNLTLQFADIQNINTSTGSFSQTFRIPATQNNLDYFGPIDKSTTVGGLNLKQRIPAELLSGSVPILRGFCQVKAIYLQKEKYADIEVVFFAGAVDLRAEVGDALLADLDLSAYNHELNLSNVQQSWLGTGIGPTIRYGLIDKGFNWSSETPPWTDTDGLWQGELTPFIRARALVDQIFTDAGLSYESDFFDSTDFGNIYLPAYNGQIAPNTEDQEDNTASAGLNADKVGPDTLQKLPLRDDVDQAVDASNRWDNTTNRYLAPFTARYSVRIHAAYNFTGAGNIKLHVYVNGSLYKTVLDKTNFGTTVGGSSDIIFDAPGTGVGFAGDAILLENGDTLELYYELSNANCTLYGDLGGTITPAIGQHYTTSLEVFAVSPALSGLDIDMSDNMPELKQIDFLLSLQKMFNLVFVPDKHRPDVLLIEPFTDYTTGGNTKDWTEKVDYSSDVTLAPTTDLQAKRYEWSYREGLDFISDAVESNLNRVYGSYRVLDPENDFATGEQKVETSLGNYIISVIPGTGFPIHRSLNTDGSAIANPLAMLAYWCGTVQSFGEWYIRNDAGTTVGPSTYFPLFSPYSADYPTITDKDLNFGIEASFIPQECNPRNTLYIEFWAQYVTELYSEEARTMRCTMRLTASDIAHFEFSDRIFIRDSYWRVLKLAYDANVEGVCQVELIKELSDIEVCEDTPTSYDDRHNVIFFNGSTISSPDFGSESCCQRYGYLWIANSLPIGGITPLNVCKPRNQATQPQ